MYTTIMMQEKLLVEETIGMINKYIKKKYYIPGLSIALILAYLFLDIPSSTTTVFAIMMGFNLGRISHFKEKASVRFNISHMITDTIINNCEDKEDLKEACRLNSSLVDLNLLSIKLVNLTMLNIIIIGLMIISITIKASM